MAELGKLKRKRGQTKARITRLIQTIDERIRESSTETLELEVLMDQLQQKFTAFSDFTKDIQALMNEEDVAVDDEEQEEVIDEVTRTKSTFRYYSQRQREVKINGENLAIGDMAYERSPSRTNVDANRINVKLPRLEIKKFFGDPCKWQTFWSQFETAVDASIQLGKGEKMVYLRSYLDGEALRSVLGLQICDENYDAAVKLLKDRFGRHDLVVNAHMQRLLKLSPVKSSTDAKGLRKLYDECEIEIRSLESLGVSSSTFGTLLCPVIMQTLPEEMRFDFIVSKGEKDNWSVDDLLAFLKVRVESRERSLLMAKCTTDSMEKKPASDTERVEDRRRDVKRFTSSSALQTSEHSKCLFCSKLHPALDCDKDPSWKSKRLRDDGRCYLCFKKGHSSTTCKERKGCTKCGRRHHVSICFAKSRKDESEPKEENVDATVVSTTSSKRKAVLLQTASVRLRSKNGPSVRVLLDGGSETSFILEDVSRKLNLPVVDEDNVHVYAFGSETPTSTIRKRVRVRLQSSVNRKNVTVIAAETKTITAATVVTPNDSVRQEMERRSLPMAETNSDGVDDLKIVVLIGSDYYWKVATGKVEWLTSTLVAVETIFGWCIQGPSSLLNCVKVNSVMHCGVEGELSKEVRNFWELEAIGIGDHETKNSDVDVKVLRKFNETINFVDGRYEVSLPWKSETENLSKNVDVAKQRLMHLARRFKRSPELFLRYKAVIEEQILEGVAQKISSNNLLGQRLYYMPHQAVIREDKTSTKVRVVFDASSSEVRKKSLNDCLESGPNLVSDLLSILLNFRRRRFGFMADIKKAFLQISVRKEDRDAMRFLWLKPNWEPGDEVIVDEYRMTRVLFGATCSPFLLAGTIKFHVEKYANEWPTIVESLKNQLYVDDFIGSEDCESKLEELKNVSTQIMADAGMELTKWSTNSSALTEKWCGSKSEGVDEVEVKGDVAVDKVLGIIWKRNDDHFSFNVNNILDFVDGSIATKRNVLKTLSRIFDPLGFVTPFTVRAKIIFQKLWEQTVEWDTKLPEVIVDEWLQWCSELNRLKEMVLERCLDHTEAIDREVHIFADASESAYGAVAYLRLTFVDGNVSTRLIMSKSRVAPLKKLTLPRLELMAAVIAARLKVYLSSHFVDVKFFLWSDAMIVIHWIRGNAKKWKPFVSNRISEIHNATELETWSHCSGATNPADKLTRGLKVADLIVDDNWWRGPDWLNKERSEWPAPQEHLPSDEISKELRAVYVSNICEVTNASVVDVSKFSSLRRLVRVVSWVLRFICNCRSSVKQKGELTVDEELIAETVCIKASQRESFSNEMNYLESGQRLPKESTLCSLNAFVDDVGILRIRGRLQYAAIPSHEKQPIVISRNSHFAKLLVVDAHSRVVHMGVQATLSEIRSRYYIHRGRQLVKQLLNKCVVCRRFQAKPFDENAAPLPADRSTPSTPFEVVGVDFAGPLYVDDESKVYILLITCATTRAVHLELVASMTTSDTILAFKRFVARRGIPSTVYSDNGRTFKRVNLELKALWKRISSTELNAFFNGLRIKWKFIVERSPWWGGFYERMVRTVKACLKKVLRSSTLSFQELATVVIECEAAINSRPLTFVYNNVDELEALTPSHILIGRRLTSLPKSTKSVDELKDKNVKTMWKHRERLSEHFWRRWSKEYLLELPSALKTIEKKSSTKPTIGDVVLIREDNVPRQRWTIARINETMFGRDGKIRACRLRIANRKIICRPIQRLYLREGSSTDNGTETVSMGGVCCKLSTKTEALKRSESVDRNLCLGKDTSTNVRENSGNIGTADTFADDPKV